MSELTVRELVAIAHTTAVEQGWWEEGRRNVGELIALMHSELSEALEEWRTQGTSVTDVNWATGAPSGFGVELADCVIRIADCCGQLGIDLSHLLEVKMAYNKTRPYRHGDKLA